MKIKAINSSEIYPKTVGLVIIQLKLFTINTKREKAIFHNFTMHMALCKEEEIK